MAEVGTRSVPVLWRGEAQAASRALVGRKDDADEGFPSFPIVGEVSEIQVKRSGAPEMVPPWREGLGTGAVLGGEEGDDLAEDGVGEVADGVFGRRVRLLQLPSSGHRTAGRRQPWRRLAPPHISDAHLSGVRVQTPEEGRREDRGCV